MGPDKALARARSLAYRRLAARPRSRAELMEYLERKELPEEAVSAVLAEFEAAGYIDDAKFARDYGRYLVEYRGFGRYALKADLRGKGVPDDDIDSAIEALFSEDGYDEQELALILARKKAASLASLTDREKARRRLTGYLRRRGYSFDIIRSVLREVI